MGFFPAGMAPCSGLQESPVMLGRALPGISAGAGALLVLWDVRGQCRSMCTLSSMPPWHSQGSEHRPCLKHGEMPHVSCFCWDFYCLCGFLPVWRGLRATSWDGGAPGELISIGMCWGCGNRLLATAAALNHSLQGLILPGVW